MRLTESFLDYNSIQLSWGAKAGSHSRELIGFFPDIYMCVCIKSGCICIYIKSGFTAPTGEFGFVCYF